jgi:hypothetical protein
VFSLGLGDKNESELLDSLSVLAFSHLNAAFTAFHLETFLAILSGEKKEIVENEKNNLS